MKLIKLSLAAAGSTPWVPVNTQQVAFLVGLGVYITHSASLTYNVQHTFDDFSVDNTRVVTISRTTTTATVTDADHRLDTGDNVVIENSGTSNFDGPQDITWIDANTYSFTCANSGPAADAGNCLLHRYHVYPHAVLTLQTARKDSNYNVNIRGIRLNVSTYVSGKVDLLILEGMGR